jgi:galactose mutarotase-like enzyme
MHHIGNEYLELSVRHTGAELCSLQSVRTGLEYLWDANPEFWANSAPILFPVIGMMKNGGYTLAGKHYEMTRHGFARNNPNFVLIDDTENTLTFSLSQNTDTLRLYPYEFRFTISYQLDQNRLRVTQRVHNLNDFEMYFSLGAHPAFCCPRHWGEAYSDYYLEFETQEDAPIWPITDGGLISSEPEPFLQGSKKLSLSRELFAKDALVFKNLRSKSVALKSENSKECLTVSFPEFPFLGIWAKYGANFVCIEPWLGIADAENTSGKIEEKEGIIRLEPGLMFSSTYTITIEE